MDENQQVPHWLDLGKELDEWVELSEEMPCGNMAMIWFGSVTKLVFEHRLFRRVCASSFHLSNFLSYLKLLLLLKNRN